VSQSPGGPVALNSQFTATSVLTYLTASSLVEGVFVQLDDFTICQNRRWGENLLYILALCVAAR